MTFSFVIPSYVPHKTPEKVGASSILNKSLVSWTSSRCIRSATIPTTLDSRYRTVIHHSTARQMERLFNALPHRLQNIRGVKTDTFKRHLDRWLRDIPDTPKIDNYGASVSAATNSITNQKKNKW